MNWEDVASIISKTAPVLGSLFGPVGSAVGMLVSGVLGVKNDPTSVAEAVKTDPKATEKLMALEEKIIEVTNNNDILRIKSVNKTMRSEITSKKWYDHWRSAWGWLSAVAFFSYIAVIIYEIFIHGVSVSDLLGSIPGMAQLFLVPGAILGVVAWHGGKRNRILAGEKSPSLGSLITNLLDATRKN